MKLVGEINELVLLDDITTTNAGEPIIIETEYNLQDGEKVAIHAKYCGTKIPPLYVYFEDYCSKQGDNQFQLRPYDVKSSIKYVIPAGTKLMVLPKVLVDAKQ